MRSDDYEQKIIANKIVSIGIAIIGVVYVLLQNYWKNCSKNTLKARLLLTMPVTNIVCFIVGMIINNSINMYGNEIWGLLPMFGIPCGAILADKWTGTGRLSLLFVSIIVGCVASTLPFIVPYIIAYAIIGGIALFAVLGSFSGSIFRH